MINIDKHGRVSASAIAAVLALCATQAAAQDAVTTVDPLAPEPVASETIAPIEILEPEMVADAPAPASESEIVEEAASEPAAKSAATARKTRARPAPAAVAPAATASPAKPEALPEPAIETIAAEAPAAPLAVAPAASAEPMLAETSPTGESVDETAMAVGGGALALLAFGGAVAATRRRRDEAESEMDSSDVAPVADMPDRPVGVEEPRARTPEPSAFSWGGAISTPFASSTRESWTERAMRGPSADNPSLSLKKRLKRAAFFDRRESNAAAGANGGVAADAGLPKAARSEVRDPAMA